MIYKFFIFLMFFNFHIATVMFSSTKCFHLHDALKRTCPKTTIYNTNPLKKCFTLKQSIKKIFGEKWRWKLFFFFLLSLFALLCTSTYINGFMLFECISSTGLYSLKEKTIIWLPVFPLHSAWHNILYTLVA